MVRNLSHVDTLFTDSGSVRLALTQVIAPSEGEPGALGFPLHVVGDAAGNAYVFEMMPPSIKVFDTTGQFVRQIGRQGSGPGEFQARALLWIVEDTLVLSDMQNGRAVLFRTSGEFLGQFAPLPCCFNIPSTAGSNGIIPVGTSVRPPSGPSFMDGFGWIRLRLDGTVVDTVIAPFLADHRVWQVRTPRFTSPTPVPNGVDRKFVIHQDGRLTFGETNGLRLARTDPTGDTVLVIELPTIRPRPIPDSAKSAMFEGFQEYARRQGGVLEGASLNDIAPNWPLWHALFTDPLDRLWVEIPGGVLIFEPNGALVARANLNPAFAQAPSRSIFITARHFFRITTDSTDAPVLEVYIIEDNTTPE